MGICFEFIYVILTMESLNLVRIFAFISALILGLVFCRFTKFRTVLFVGLFFVLLIIFGSLLFLSEKITGWAILSFTLPFFIAYIMVVGLYYFVQKILIQIREAKAGL